MSELDDLRHANAALQDRVTALEAALAAKPLIERAPLFALLQAIPLQIGVIDGGGACVFLSANFSPWLLAPSEPVHGQQFTSVVVPGLAAVAQALVSGSGVRTRDLTVADRNGSVRDLHIALSPRQIGPDRVDGVIWIAQDLTHHRLADEALRLSERRLSLATEAAGLGVWDWDLSANTMVYSEQAKAIYGFPADEPVTYETVRDATHPDDYPRTSAMAQRAIDPILREKIPYEYRITRADGAIRWLLAHGEAIFEDTAAGPLATRYVGTIQDITDRTRAAERRQFLINELNHRVKNTLATVQSIAHQTLRSGQSAVEARDLLTSRLIALSGAHDILTREDWETADLRDIVATCISPFEPEQGARFDVRGPALRVAPKAAVALAMALHELVTNAVKYGALSTEPGRVAITWSLADRDGDPRLILDWTERGGPPVKTPERMGFGSRLLVQGLSADLGAAAQLTYDPAGLRCRIDAPLIAATAFEPA
ncbi:HWE histidine kinase domain-containing protein [Phenylobacterium sp.]|uniref:sensor histidine kinase n=1 Tax=Phenylobacterium sp. TaxID=1871053 RepID=UPI0030F4A80A